MFHLRVQLRDGTRTPTPAPTRTLARCRIAVHAARAPSAGTPRRASTRTLLLARAGALHAGRHFGLAQATVVVGVATLEIRGQILVRGHVGLAQIALVAAVQAREHLVVAGARAEVGVRGGARVRG